MPFISSANVVVIMLGLDPGYTSSNLVCGVLSLHSEMDITRVFGAQLDNPNSGFDPP